jgi:hypothetical protein
MRRLVVIALLFVAGCGFEREAPFAGARVPDVGPWQDIGPVTLCQGHARAIAPSLGDAGICQSGDAPACTSDDACGSRERCLCGRCTVVACDSADECTGGFVCSFADRRCDKSCDADGDCAAGERCVPGRHVCRGSCTANADCQHGEFCQTSTGLCTSTICTSDADCSRGTCDAQRFGALIAEPTPFIDAAGVHLWLERTDADGVARIWHAVGADGLSFTLDDAPLFDGAAPTFAPLADGTLALVFAHGANLYAVRATAGLSSAPSASSAWSAPTLALPNARQPSLTVAPDGTPLLFAVDADGNVTRFVGTSDLVFSTPVVVLTPAGARTPLWPDVDALASPFADAYTDADGSPRLRLWFAAHGTESGPSSQFGTPTPTPPDYSVGVAVSTDGVTFIPDAYNPVFDRITDFINHPSELDPAVARFGDRWLIYYRRARADGSAGETLAVARSPAVPR